ncbi:MAG: endonuclease/exonuclease/phosphatase family protein [Microscillaceae bacterium]|jgi:predicted extracellular nuclease|nr:endonuclease/exonuclease/phosphatase family protein [Microscillaceae bacterium]
MSVKIFKVGTFNLLNLALPGQVFYERNKYTQTEYNRKTDWIAHQLDNMKADIVGFQEVWHETAVKQALAKSAHLNQANLVVTPQTGGTPSVGIASNFPILNHRVIQDFPETWAMEGIEIPIKSFSRAILQADIQINEDLIVTCFVAHLKSKRPDLNDDEDRGNPIHKARGEARSLIRRVAEAVALRTVIMQKLQNRDSPVIVLGDLNDGNMAVSTQLISSESPFRKWPAEVRKQIWDVLLYHVKDIQARRSYHDMYFTHIHNGHYEALDHIMVSQELVAENPRAIGRVGYVSVFNDHLIDETLSEDEIPNWQSDHGQVVASIELK